VDRVVNEQERVHTSKILSNALEWGVKILYVEDLREYLWKKKVVGSQYPAAAAVRKNIKAELTAKQHLQKCKGGRISKPFVKIEDSSRHYRPIYISLPNMPQFNLRSLPPCSPFLATDRDAPGKKLHPHRRVKATASEEKAQNGRRRNREKRGGGYCECCMIKYESITRVSFSLHFVIVYITN
uniref:DBF4-type domain-containing protein n=1 Tax=Tetraodon nigroviridis TaxID=99883 RepID=H3BWY6_TETNG